MTEILKTPTRIINAFFEVLSTEPEKKEISEFRVKLKSSHKGTAFFYPRKIYRTS